MSNHKRSTSTKGNPGGATTRTGQPAPTEVQFNRHAVVRWCERAHPELRAPMARGMLTQAVQRAKVTKVAPTWTRMATNQLLRDDYFLVIDDDYCFPIVWNDGRWEAKTCIARGRFE